MNQLVSMVTSVNFFDRLRSKQTGDGCKERRVIGFCFNQWKMFDMAGTNLRYDLDIEEMGSSWGSNSVCILTFVKRNNMF